MLYTEAWQWTPRRVVALRKLLKSWATRNSRSFGDDNPLNPYYGAVCIPWDVPPSRARWLEDMGCATVFLVRPMSRLDVFLAVRITQHGIQLAEKMIETKEMEPLGGVQADWTR